MHASRIALLLVTAILAQGCRTPARYVGYGVLYPEPANFSLKGKLDRRPMALDTSKVYVCTMKDNHEPYARYSYLRFWADGRCFRGTAAHRELTLDVVESLRIGEPGYFIVEGDTITMENFSPEYSGSYAVSRGTLIKDAEGNTTIRILETRYVGGFSLSLVRTYHYPHFGSPWLTRSDFYPVDFGPLRAMPTWGGDLEAAPDAGGIGQSELEVAQ